MGVKCVKNITQICQNEANVTSILSRRGFVPRKGATYMRNQQVIGSCVFCGRDVRCAPGEFPVCPECDRSLKKPKREPQEKRTEQIAD